MYIYTQDGGFAILKWEICCKLTTDSFLPFCSPKRLATRCGLSWTSQCVFLKQSWGIMRWHFEDPTPHNPHSVRDVGHLPRSTADMRKRKWTSCIVASHLSESVRHTYLKLTSPSHPTPPHCLPTANPLCCRYIYRDLQNGHLNLDGRFFFPGYLRFFPGKTLHIFFASKMHKVQKYKKWCNYAHAEKNQSKSRNLPNEHLL